MAELQAQYRTHTNRWRPFGQYTFSEANRPQWTAIWEAAGGDLEKVVKYGKSAKYANPHEFAAALHRFLFWMWPESVEVQRGSYDVTRTTDSGGTGVPRPPQFVAQSKRPTSFVGYLKTIAEQHEKEPEDRDWYHAKGITPAGFVQALRVAGKQKDVSDSAVISQVNARVPDLGYRLFEAYLLLTFPEAKPQLSQMRDNLRRVAADIRQEMTAV